LDDYDEIKKTKKDTNRLGYKPLKGENQWSRICQNSGKIRRQPMIFKSNEHNKLINLGYKLNEKTKIYEKIITVKNKKIKLTTLNLPNENNEDVFYICDEKMNDEYIYLGFLSKSKNPNDLCMPCCFKKNQLEWKNKTIKNFFNSCINNNVDYIKNDF